MPTTAENRARWDTYEWSEDGAEWLVGFGGEEAAWRYVLWPRIRHFLPAEHVVEIGPGHGLWTQRLLEHAANITCFDVAETCVAFCAERFAGDPVDSRLTDGTSLPGLDAGSVGFCLSFNSLVHAEADHLAGYCKALAHSLAPGGFALLHHSNLAACLGEPGFGPELEHWRGRTASAEGIREAATEAGFEVSIQELVPWGSPHLIDAFTLLRKPRGRFDRWRTRKRPVPRRGIEERHGFWLDLQGEDVDLPAIAAIDEAYRRASRG